MADLTKFKRLADVPFKDRVKMCAQALSDNASNCGGKFKTQQIAQFKRIIERYFKESSNG